MSRRSTIIMLAVAMAVPTAVLQAGGASAACQYEYHWEYSNVRTVHRKFPGNTFKDGPGGQITVSVEHSSTVSRSVNATVGVEGGPPLVSVKAEVSAGAEKSRTATLGHEYSHKISRGHYGHAAYGSWAKKFTYKKIGREPHCPDSVLAKGTAVYPTRAVGWRYWETKS